MGREAFCPVKSSSAGKCQDREAGVGGWVSTLIGAGGGKMDRGFPEGKPGKGITFEM